MYNQILLVNPYSSSAYLDKNLQAQGINTVAIYTSEDINSFKYFAPPPNLFNQQIFLPGASFEQVIAALGDKQFDYIINGSEVSLLLSDRLAQHYTPQYANNPDSFELRFNKYLMHEKLNEKGLSHIRQTLFYANRDDLNSLAVQLPCFIKPLVGGGSIGAKKIITQEELYDYFHSSNISAVGAKNKVYKIDDSDIQFLIAELLVGKEYFVDSFSVHGHHHLSSVQFYQRKFINNVPVALFSEILPNSQLTQEIVEYIFSCLSALGIDNGFAHTDLFVTPDGQVKLVEANCRIAGVKGASNSLASLSGRPSQIDLLLKYIYPDKIQTKKQVSHDYFTRINVYNPKIFGNGQLDKFKPVKEVFCCELTEDNKIEYEVSLTDVTGFILCSDPDPDLLHSEVEKIAELVI